MTNQGAGNSQRTTDPSLGEAGTSRPRLVVFDVNETLSDMSPMGQRFQDVGAPAHLAETWFAGLLRDGFALATVGASEPFARLAGEALRVRLHGLSLNRETDEAIGHILTGFAGLGVHADVPAGIRALRGQGIRLVTLSNGSTAVAEELFERAGIRDEFEALLSVEQAGAWKPASTAYDHALEQCGVSPADAMLVAVHPWDIDGAARAGLRTAWINRTAGPYPDYFTTPDLAPRSLVELAEQLR
jgi:2-haloacid dehalogenase